MQKLTFLFLLLPYWSISQTEKPDQDLNVIEVFENGKIDWTNQYIEVSGISIKNPQKFTNPTQCLEMAKRGALVVAKANLLEIIEGVSITSEMDVKDFVAESYGIQAKVEGVVKGVRQVGPAKEEGDVVTVTVRMPLAGNGGLAPIFIENVKKHREAEKEDAKKRGGKIDENPKTDSTSVREREQNMEGKTTDKVPNRENLTTGNEQIVLNLKDGKFDPKLFPVIVDEDGNVIVDYSELYEKYGGNIVQYVKVAEEVAKGLDWEKGKEIIEAVQSPNGNFIINTKKHPKFNKMMKHAWKVGKFALPFVLGML